MTREEYNAAPPIVPLPTNLESRPDEIEWWLFGLAGMMRQARNDRTYRGRDEYRTSVSATRATATIEVPTFGFSVVRFDWGA